MEMRAGTGKGLFCRGFKGVRAVIPVAGAHHGQAPALQELRISAAVENPWTALFQPFLAAEPPD